jgi:hypothetical protein
MYDPLNTTSNSGFEDPTANPFASSDSAPAWPSTPHPPGSPVPNLRRASPALPQTPDKGPSLGWNGREPQIYGQPATGLVSPSETTGSNGQSFEKPDPYLKVRITGLDRNRRDILIKFDAQVRIIGLCIPFQSLIICLDKFIQLHWHHLSQCVAILLGVSTVLRSCCPEQPTDYYPCSSSRPDISTDR